MESRAAISHFSLSWLALGSGLSSIGGRLKGLPKKSPCNFQGIGRKLNSDRGLHAVVIVGFNEIPDD